MIQMPPHYSFIIPVKPNGTVSALPYLERLSNEFACEIIVVEGRSPSRQRNIAAQKSAGDILYFIDDDSRISPSCLHICTEHFGSEAVAVVGGPSLTPPDNSLIQQLFGHALSSLFGAGSMRNRYRIIGKARLTSQKELILCNMAIRRDVFIKMGGFDERLYPNEENELLDRIRAEGLQLIHDPALAVYRSQRPSISAFTKQMFNYGRGRGEQTCLTHKIPVASAVPMFFVAYLLLLPLTLLLSKLAIIPLLLYLILCLTLVFTEMLRLKSVTSVFLLFIYPLMHISNGLGLAYGVIKGIGDKMIPDDSTTVTIRIVKPFQNELK